MLRPAGEAAHARCKRQRDAQHPFSAASLHALKSGRLCPFTTMPRSTLQHMAAAWQLPQLLCLLLAASWATSGAAQDPAWAFSCPSGACSKQQVASQAQADPVLRDLSLQRSGNIANSPVEGIVLQQFAVWAASVGYVGPIDPNSPQFANFVLNMRQVRQVRLRKEPRPPSKRKR